ncbi:MAG: family 16 glycoside hydrolase [Planctomycetota bacterium]|jgi:hypothetical protein
MSARFGSSVVASPSPRRGLAAVAVIVILLIVDLVIIGLVLSGTRDYELSLKRVETIEAFYAAEAGMNMAIREVLTDVDEDGDCGIGTISHDGDSGTDPAFGLAACVATAETAGALTTIRSYGRSGTARRQMLVVVDPTPAADFSDDFEDGVITGWTSIGEDLMEESGGSLRTESGVNTKCHYTVDGGEDWTDYTASVDIRSVDNDPAGISFRVQDANNFYVFRQKFGDGSWDLDIQEWVGGVAADLITIDNYGSGPGQIDDPNAWYTFKVVISGTNIKGYIDDELRLEVDDSRFAKGTAGLWLWSETDAEFDNMLVEP